MTSTMMSVKQQRAVEGDIAAVGGHFWLYAAVR
jgi:hypothetical protein